MQSPRRTAGLSGSELAVGLCAQRAVELDILLFCLALEALALLKGLPAGAALVAAAVVGGTLALTGKHGGSPFCGAGGTVPVQCRPDQSPTATMAL